MYWYIVFGEVQPPGIWEEIEEVIPTFTLDSEVVLSDTISRFTVDDVVLPLLTYLPRRRYRFSTPLPGMRLYLEQGKWLVIQTTKLDMEPEVVRWLGTWLRT